MSAGLHRLGLFYYNFTSILCLNFENGSYNNSSIQAFFNVLKAPFVFIFVLFVASQRTFNDTIFIKTFINLEEFSKFSRISITVIIVIMQGQVILLGILQVLRKYEIFHFIERASAVSLDKKYAKKFVTLCLKRTLTSNFVLLTISIAQFYGSMRISLLSLAVMVICSYPVIVMFSFVTFVISFESFAIVLLKQFKKDLKNSSTSLNHEIYFKLSQQYQEIFELIREFKKSFGAQLTTITVLYIFCLVFNVSSTLDSFISYGVSSCFITVL